MNDTDYKACDTTSETRSVILDKVENDDLPPGAVLVGGWRSKPEVVKQELYINGKYAGDRNEKLSAPTISRRLEAPVPVPRVEGILPAQPDLVLSPRVIEPTNYPVIAAVVPRVKVILKNSKIGKMTVFCSAVAISDSLFVMQYPADGQTTIVEPPCCMSDDPLVVEYSGKTYQCISDGWAVEINSNYLVMLVRLPEPA